MNIRDLIRGKKFDTPATAPSRRWSRYSRVFLYGIRLQLDDVETLFLQAQLLQLSDQRGLTEQEHMRTAFRRTGGQGHQGFERGLVELLGVIHQQIDFLTGQRQLHHLRQNRADLGLGNVQRLGNLPQDASRIAGATGGNHHALHGLFVGAGHQGLAQQRLAAALGAL